MSGLRALQHIDATFRDLIRQADQKASVVISFIAGLFTLNRDAIGLVRDAMSGREAFTLSSKSRSSSSFSPRWRRPSARSCPDRPAGSQHPVVAELALRKDIAEIGRKNGGAFGRSELMRVGREAALLGVGRSRRRKRLWPRRATTTPWWNWRSTSSRTQRPNATLTGSKCGRSATVLRDDRLRPASGAFDWSTEWNGIGSARRRATWR